MPKVVANSTQTVTPYGVTENSNALSLQDRLLERFKPHEYVKVINVDDEPYMWQYMPSELEEYDYTSDGMHRHTRRSDPEVWQLEPGESETIIGANALLMIDGLYKKMKSKNVIATTDVKPGQARAFNYADGNSQEQWIDRILIGKEVPSFISLNDKE